MLARRLQTSLVVVQLVAFATLLRSIAFDRWITVFASLVLLLAAAAAKRGRAWGVALTFAQAAAFPVAWLIGIAPPWFCLVGVVGAIPFLLTRRAFETFDRTAARVLAVLALAGGAIGAVAWKAYAWSIFEAWPALTPSRWANHGLLVAAVASVGMYLALRKSKDAGERGARLRVGTPARISASAEERIEAFVDPLEEETEATKPERRRLSL